MTEWSRNFFAHQINVPMTPDSEMVVIRLRFVDEKENRIHATIAPGKVCWSFA